MTITQSNFSFLKGHNDFLFSIAQAAEKNYPDDPNTTLVKLRIFGEYVANHLGKLLNIELLKRIATARAEAEALALSAKKTAKKVGIKNVK